MSALSRSLVAAAAVVSSIVATVAVASPPAVAAVGDEVVAWLEVEDGVIAGGPGFNSGDHGNFSGTGSYTFRETGMTSTMTVTAPAAGVYPVHVRYAAGPLGADENVTRSMGLVTNGVRQQVTYPMTSFGDWETWRFATTQVDLVEGANTIAISCDRAIDFCRLNFDAVQVGGATPDPCPAVPPREGWTSLYDGTFVSFDGWRKAGVGGFGRQTDCSIRSIRGAGATWLTQERAAPYTLELDWRRNDSNDDSSVYLGSSARGATPTGGYRVRIGADDTGVIETVGGAQQAADATALAGALHPVGEWNTFRIAVTATGLEVRLNGVVVNELAAAVPASGFVGLENRSFLDVVDFRGIQVRAGVEPEVPDPVATTTSLTLSPSSLRVVTGKARVAVAVAATGATPAGDVEIRVGGVLRATVPVVDGVASAQVGPFPSVGARTIEARYLGDETTLPSSATGKLSVVKAAAAVSATVQPTRVIAKRTRAALVVRVRAAGFTPTGVVRVSLAGRAYAGRLVGGRVVLRLATFRRTGSYRAAVVYAGDARTLRATRSVTVRVVRR